MDVRKEFLEFFKSKGHKEYKSMSLVPNDSTLLFTNAGMVQFKDIFTAQKPIPEIPRGTSCQLCVRAGGKHNDLDNIGYTRRHQTLFEMLGNFSFGDYFKETAIDNAHNFITNILDFKKKDLYITVHEKDEEAYKLWRRYIDASKIKKMGDKDNLWQMGEVGPWGYCSEIFIDQGDKYFKDSEDYFGGEGDRFLEIWNLVFMQFESKKNGENIVLPKPSIDTGMGLERVVALKEKKLSNFDTSLFMPLIFNIEELTKKKYFYDSGASFRVIADHIRSISFLLAHGVTFDREGRGYVLRRILRRAVRHGYLLGLNEPFLYKLVDKLIDIMGYHYTEILDNKDYIKTQILSEENKFFNKIFDGMKMFEKELSMTNSNIFSGKAAFKLYDTYGFPLDLTEDMLKDKNMKINMHDFNALMQNQKNMAKASWKGSGDKNIDKKDILNFANKISDTQFIGYERLNSESKVVGLFDSNMKKINILKSNEDGYVLFNITPFYGRSGGQEGDIGFGYKNDKEIIKVLDTIKIENLHISKVNTQTTINLGDDISLEVNKLNRREISRHHSSIHVLNKVLMDKFDNIKQAGSYVSANKMRFDFTFDRALTDIEIVEIEQEVNRRILESKVSKVEIMPIEKAKKTGATFAFGDKYGDLVRVVSIGDSMELCGGTHVKNIGEIGSFYIQKESSVSSGIRRIEGVCSLEAINMTLKNKQEIEEIKKILKSTEIIDAIHKIESKIKIIKKEKSVKKYFNLDSLKPERIFNTNVVLQEIRDLEIDLKITIDEIKNKYKNVVIVLFRKSKNNISIVVGSQNNNIKANLLLNEIINMLDGKGGGRVDFAQGIGKNISKLNDSLKKSKEYITSNI